MTYECNICGKTFTRPYDLKRHVKYAHSDALSVPPPMKRTDSIDSYASTGSSATTIPRKVNGGNPRYYCYVCDSAFTTQRDYDKHVKKYPSHKKSAVNKLKETTLMQSTSKVMFAHPFCMQVAGPSRSGKTHWLSRLLKARARHIQPSPRKVFYCYAHWQAAYDFMQDDNIEFHEGLPSTMYINTLADCMLVLDDLMDEAMGDKKLMSLCTEGSHHKLISVIFIVQNLFHQARQSRTISLNMTYLVLFKMVRDRSQVGTLARQLFPGKAKEFMDYYEEMTRAPYGKLILDLHPQTADNHRFIRDKVSSSPEEDEESSAEPVSDYFQKLETRNRHLLEATNPYLAEAQDTREELDRVLQDTSLPDDLKARRIAEVRRTMSCT